MITFFILILLLFLIDLYVFQALKLVIQDLAPNTRQYIKIGYWTLFAAAIVVFSIFANTPRHPVVPLKTYLTSLFFILYASKLLIVFFLFVDDLVRVGKLTINALPADVEFDPSRSKFLSQMGFLVAAVPFSAFIYGMVKGAYDYRIKHITLKFPNLPQAFDGYKVLQISDLHTGSFQNTEPLQEAVRLINKQEADLVFFTGDLVNNVATELYQHIETLKGIESKDGVFSVLGNHDYGDYVTWSSAEAKKTNLRNLIDSHGKMGWKLLMNEHHKIEKDGENIAILGVENWGNKAHFPKYGDLKSAYAGTENSPFKVLLSHDPSHWDGEINQLYQDIDLTLSGHTHGMQFGVNIPGLKWSPVQYMYKQWAGLYQKGKQYLYVNTGLGFIGYPGRVGFLPEITVFELKKT